MVKNLHAMQETLVRSLGQEDPLKKGMATHSRYSCLRNSMGRGKVGHYQTTLSFFHFYTVSAL